jgi:hypothetical protein
MGRTMPDHSPARPGGLRRWLARGLTQVLALALAFAAGAIAMHVGMHAGDRDHLRMLQDQVGELQLELSRNQSEQAALRSQAEVQDGTQRVLQDKITGLQQELGHTRDQLAFYEQLIPPGPAGAVAVRAFDLRQDGEFLHYRVLLTRNAAPQAAAFKGRMRFVANGRLQGKTVKMALSPPVASADASGDTGSTVSGADPLELVFEQFQRSTGVLQLIPGLMIDSVSLEILEGDVVRATQDAGLNRAGSAPGATQ